jgi:hypothetical protein
MKIKIDQPIKDFAGKPIEAEKNPATRGRDGIVTPAVMEIVTFRTIIEQSLNAQSDAHPLTAEKKLQAFQIGVKLFTKKLEQYDLTVDQASFLKERIGLFYGPVVYGRFLELIEDETIKTKEE